MKIIGAGLPRTGTLSTRAALESLALAPCFHGDSIVTLNLSDPVTQFYRGDKEALLDVLRSYPAGLDWPIVALVDELMIHNPDARVLLNIRDSGEVWVRSFRATIWQLMQLPVFTRIHGWFGEGSAKTVTSVEFNRLFDLFFERIVEHGNRYAERKLRPYSRNFTDEEYVLMYDNWVEFVKCVVPPERLLVFNVKDGIAPLATFCQLPVPEWTMPNRNDKGRFAFLIVYLKISAIIIYLIFGALIYGMLTLNKSIVIFAVILLVLYRFRLVFERFLGRNVMPKFDPTKKGL